ncbi:hypothetical protein V6N13_033862 [Hibiscus sabdariffa]
MDVFQQSNGSEVKGAVQETCLEGTVVPNSLISKSMNSMEMVRMWKGNKVEDWRVIETTSWMAEEDIEIIHRDEELRCNAVNLSVKYDLREEIQAASGGKSLTNSLINRGPQYMANAADNEQKRLNQSVGEVGLRQSNLVRIVCNSSSQCDCCRGMLDGLVRQRNVNRFNTCYDGSDV